MNLKGVNSLVGIDASVLVDLALYDASIEYFQNDGPLAVSGGVRVRG